MSLLSTLAAAAVVLLAVLPGVLRWISSPFILVFVLPCFVVVFSIGLLALRLVIGHHLDKKRQPKANRLAQAARPFSFATPAAWQAVLTRSQWSESTPQSLPLLLPDYPIASEEINEIVSFIIRDFVQAWYKDISSSSTFPTAVSELVHTCLDKILGRATQIDLPALIVKRILPKVTAHIEQFRHSEVALRGAGLERHLTQSEELDLLLASRYTERLHPAVDNLSTSFTRQSEEMHLRNLVDKVLPFVLPETEGKSKALKIVAREIMACSVLYPVMEMLSDPDFWNRTIDQVAGAAIHQQKLITKVRNVLEAQSPRPNKRTAAPSGSAPPETINIHTDIQQFESFLRSISRCSSLLDARRLKNDVMGEIRRTRVLLANHENEDWIEGKKTEEVVAFLDRLYSAKRKVEKRIIVLGGEDDISPHSSAMHEQPSNKPAVTLRDILQNSASLSYFMEFMDRRSRSMLVQFWLTVESFKNPLESFDMGLPEDDDDDEIQDPSTTLNAKEDITMMNDLYFSSANLHPLLSNIPQRHVDAIKDFCRDPSPSVAQQRKARRSVMMAQKQIEKDLEQDFEEFEQSDLWFRAIGDTDFASKRAPVAHQGELSTAHPSVPLSAALAGPQPIRRTDSSGSGKSMLSILALPPPRPSNIEVLMSPSSEKVEATRAPLFDDPDDQLQRAEENRIEALQAALTDIMLDDQHPRKQTAVSVDRPLQDRPSKTRSSTREKRRAVFEVEAEGEEGEDIFPENDTPEEANRSFQLAAPGDLQLSYEITRLGDKITNLKGQDVMLDTLIRKADLTGDNQELKLLNRSKFSLSKEIRELQFQKTQYEQQESANRLISERTRVSIVSSTVGEEDGKSVVRFLIEIQQLATDGSFSSGWVVARRYNEFLNMHNRLREKYGLVRNLDFPGKRLVTAMSGPLLDARKVGLEKYLQNVVAIPIVCESDELRNFLSRDSPFTAAEPPPPSNSRSGTSLASSGNLVKNMYRSVTESIDDMFFGPSMLDVMIQRLTRQAAEFAGIIGSGVTDEDLVAQALGASNTSASTAAMMHLSADLKPLEGESSTSTFSAPICDLLLALFELNKETNVNNVNWLRRQAIVVILQQVLGSTIERKTRETTKSLLDESRILSYIKTFRDGLWPDGKLKPATVPRSMEEKLRTRDDANRNLSALVPDLAANMIGRSNARRGARRIFAVLQNRRLNQHIIYTIVDEVFAAIFPETKHNS